MKFFRRSLVALGIAATLPTVVFAALGVFYLLKIERDRLEATTLDAANHLIHLVDGRCQRDLAVLSVLAGSSTLVQPNWKIFHARAAAVLAANPEWATVLVLDAHESQQIQTGGPEGVQLSPIPASHLDAVQEVLSTRAAMVGDIERGEEPVVWLYAPADVGEEARYIIAASVRAQVFQDILLTEALSAGTSALVDRHGNFIARSRDYEARVGTPATRFVREAIVQGQRGFYAGETYEGLKNYTAFDTSSRTRWSIHIAVPSSLIDSPTAWSLAIAGLAGLGAVLLAGVLVVLVLRDMAERRRAEEALRQSQKMEAVGQLTGGIAHDFNNLLTAIIGNLDMIHTRAAGNERVQRAAANALEAARRGAKLAAQLLAFSRTQRMVVRRIDLQQLLSGMSGLLTQSVGPSIRVEIEVDPDATFVVSDLNQLELALLNLAVNARDAMNGSGTLTIRAKRASDVDRSLPAGDYVNLSVSDTGSGMTEEVRARAVEPFFTTKPTGQGTGLGLSQVYGVVRESGGTLLIDSEPGRGTTISLILKRASEITASPMTRPGKPLPARAETATHENASVRVLVVDDDRLVRRFMSESLRALGFQVTDCADGQSGIDALRSNAFDLLIVDFAMPGMNGAEVARVARGLHPKLKILIVSGYADSLALEAAVGDAPQLRKPFDMAELQTAVKQLLALEPA